MSSLDFSLLLTTWPFLLQGFLFTIQITLTGFAGGIILGSCLAVARLSQNPIIFILATSYVTIMRSLPLILVIFWFFFIVPWAIGKFTGSGRPVPVGASMTVFTTFVLFEAAYFSEIVRAGIRSVSPGQFSASEALGFSKFQSCLYIIFPQAFRNVLPILVTQTIILFQDTSLVYVISATDLLGAATKVAQRDFRLVEMYLTAGAVYFIFCFAASQLAKLLQDRLTYGANP